MAALVARLEDEHRVGHASEAQPVRCANAECARNG